MVVFAVCGKVTVGTAEPATVVLPKVSIISAQTILPNLADLPVKVPLPNDQPVPDNVGV
jgi:hypothetical protein